MAKKKITSEFHGENEDEREEVSGIVPISIDTGREDLNTVVAKINEIISHINHIK